MATRYEDEDRHRQNLSPKRRRMGGRRPGEYGTGDEAGWEARVPGQDVWPGYAGPMMPGPVGPYGGGFGPGPGYGYRGEGDRDPYGGGYDRRRGRADEGGRDWFDRASDEVASWFGSEDAEERRREDRREDHAGKGPSGYRRSDVRIAEEVHDRLTDDPDLDATEISASVEDGEVTLDGEAPSRDEKYLAEDCAASVRGVTHVQNNLRIRREPPQGLP